MTHTIETVKEHYYKVQTGTFAAIVTQFMQNLAKDDIRAKVGEIKIGKRLALPLSDKTYRIVYNVEINKRCEQIVLIASQLYEAKEFFSITTPDVLDKPFTDLARIFN
jgi:hypothetical protein